MTPSDARIDTFSQEAPYSLATVSARSWSLHLRMLGETKNPSTVNAHAASRMAAEKQMAILFAREGISDLDAGKVWLVPGKMTVRNARAAASGMICGHSRTLPLGYGPAGPLYDN